MSLLTETLENFEYDAKQNIGTINQFYIKIENYSIGSEKIFSSNENNFIDILKDLENFNSDDHKISGWISFKDGSWMEREHIDFYDPQWVYRKPPIL